MTSLLLDFDGTLANTEPVHQEALKTFFIKNGFEFSKKEAGKSTLKIFEEWGKEFGREELAKELSEEYSFSFLPQFFVAHPEKIQWQPDALSFLEWAKDFPKMLVTGSYRSWLEAVDPFLGVFAKFPIIVTKDDVLPFEKPHPMAYELAIKKMGIKANEAIAIEDSRSGILSAKSAGCRVIAIKRDSDLGFENADFVVNDLLEARKYLS